MDDKNTITVNGVEYVKASSIAASDHIIVIAQRGWIFVGRRDTGYTDFVLRNAYVVRKWTNGLGIGGLTTVEHKDDYTLDMAGTVTIPADAVIAILDCEW